MNFVVYTYLLKDKQIRIINNVPSTQVNRWWKQNYDLQDTQGREIKANLNFFYCTYYYGTSWILHQNLPTSL